MSITLVQYKRGYGCANLSPFCRKVEILLKMAGLDYAVQIENDPRKTPKGKLPYIIDDGQTIADSTFIQAHLETKYEHDFNAGLSPAQRAQAHAFARMCEERLYWVIVYSRWTEPENWPKMKAFWFGDLPPIIRSIIPGIALKEVKRNLHAQGVGRHELTEIYTLGRQDLNALAHQLADKAFLFGEAPTAVDAVVSSIVIGLLIEDFPSPLLEHMQTLPALGDYSKRCSALWFPDIEAGPGDGP